MLFYYLNNLIIDFKCISVMNISFTIEFYFRNFVNVQIFLKLSKNIECTEYIATWNCMLGLVPLPLNEHYSWQ